MAKMKTKLAFNIYRIMKWCTFYDRFGDISRYYYQLCIFSFIFNYFIFQERRISSSVCFHERSACDLIMRISCNFLASTGMRVVWITFSVYTILGHFSIIEVSFLSKNNRSAWNVNYYHNHILSSRNRIA